MKLTTRVLTSLSKVFPDEECRDRQVTGGTGLRGELCGFQVAYRVDTMALGVRVSVDSPPELQPTVRLVGLVPCELPFRNGHDDRVLRTTPGLYPDPLLPLETAITIPPAQWRAVWVSVDIPGDCAAGVYPIQVSFSSADAAETATYRLEVLPFALPPQRLIHTEWFHQDCLATVYGVPVHSEEHWRILERFLACAVRHGINAILTPLFTPPLDTRPGGERPTVQLVGVVIGDGGYRFDFSLLDRWVGLCEGLGIRHFEMSHLATQWGAAWCPKIVARDGAGREQRLFGWDDSSTGERYLGFLDAFLPELDRFLAARGIADRCFFHVSDEPRLEHLATYSRFAAHVKHLLPGYTFVDALSDFAFYESGIVTNPIPASDHIEPFLEAGIAYLWTYYCVSQWDRVSNRYFIMPSIRNRIIGFQLFKHGIRGFLHWGFNFYYSGHSMKQDLDPFRTTDADCSFPSGDAFLVYPGKGGIPVESLRLEVFHEALQDLRLFEAAAAEAGTQKVVETFEASLGAAVTFSEYPCDIAVYLRAREAVQGLLDTRG